MLHYLCITFITYLTMPKKLAILSLLGLVVIIGILAYAVRANRESQQLKAQLEELQKNPQEANEEEVNQLVEQVGKLIVLPEDEKPTVATVSDKEKLKETTFFSKAENGDKVLIYVNAKKAILYRPSSQKIIEVATINLNTAAQNQNLEGKVVLRNGTTVVGLTARFEEAMKRVLPKIEVTGRDNAKQTAFTETIVVDLSGNKREDAQRLAAAIGARVGALPSDETKPENADFLVIIARDKVTATSPTASPLASPAQ
jgi:hypothetical protein